MEGRQGYQVSPHAYCLSNGRIRVIVGTENPQTAAVKKGVPIWIGVWDGSAWDWKLFRFNTNADDWSSVVAARVVKNRPEVSSMAYHIVDTNNFGFTLTLTLRRGASHIEVHCRSHSYQQKTFRVAIDENRAGSALSVGGSTAGWVTTATDPEGHKYWACSVALMTNTLTAGPGTYLTNNNALKTFAGAIGILSGGTVGTTITEYFAAQGEAQRVVVP
jgi:hypothetical protein